MSALLSTEEARAIIPIFKVWPDQGTHPPVALNRSVCVIGRHEAGVHLPLRSPQVSKLHALVVRDGGRVYLRDLASTNGVQRNGAPIQEAGLSDADVLRIGSYTLRCQSGFTDEATAEGEASDESVASLPAGQLRGADGRAFPFPVGQQTVLIGRRLGCDVRLDDPSVAPVHAIVFQLDGRRVLRDLDSPRGTRINGRSIHQEALEPGTEVRFGSVTLRFELLEVSASALELPGVSAPAEENDLVVPLADVAPEASPALPEPYAEPTRDAVTLGDEPGPEISLEDSRAPGTPDVGLEDSNLIEPDPPVDPSFHGEIVEPVSHVIVPAEAAQDLPMASIMLGEDLLIAVTADVPDERPRPAAPSPAPAEPVAPLGSHANDPSARVELPAEIQATGHRVQDVSEPAGKSIRTRSSYRLGSD